MLYLCCGLPYVYFLIMLNKFHLIRRIAISAVLSVFASGLSAAPAYRNPAGSQFPILAWYSVLGDDELTPERYRELSEPGINISFSHLEHNTQIEKALKACEGTGVKLIITSYELVDSTAATVERFKNNPNVAGYFLRDEPVVADFPALRRFRDRVCAADTTRLPYMNLFPSFVEPQQLGVKNYDEYVQRFIDEIDIPMVSFDLYPIVCVDGRIFVRDTFFSNLESVSRVAKANSRPFWAFCLATQHGPYPLPTAVHLRHEAFSALAYGAQGIQYFTYWTPRSKHSETWDYRNAPIDETGHRSSVWYLMRDLNREIQSLKWAFLGSEVIDVAHTGDSIPEGTHRLNKLPSEFQFLNADGKGVLVSQFKNGKNNFLMIVNRDIDRSQNITLRKDRKVTRVLSDGSTIKDNNGTTVIAPGDYLLYTWR